MKIVTEYQLDQYLSDQIIWRKRELHFIRSQIQKCHAAHAVEEEKTFIRSALAMLYAHWEGFVSDASSTYLRYVALRRLPWNSLQPSFLALHIQRQLNIANDRSRIEVLTDICEMLLGNIGERSQIPHRHIIQTKSNLNSKVLREIMCMLSLDYSVFITKEKLLDAALVDNRNAIAHGEELIVDYEEYLGMHDLVIELLEAFRNQVLKCASDGIYRRVAHD